MFWTYLILFIIIVWVFIPSHKSDEEEDDCDIIESMWNPFCLMYWVWHHNDNDDYWDDEMHKY